MSDIYLYLCWNIFNFQFLYFLFILPTPFYIHSFWLILGKSCVMFWDYVANFIKKYLVAFLNICRDIILTWFSYLKDIILPLIKIFFLDLYKNQVIRFRIELNFSDLLTQAPLRQVCYGSIFYETWKEFCSLPLSIFMVTLLFKSITQFF